MSGILRSMLGGLGTGMANVGKDMYADAAATDLVKYRDELERERENRLREYQDTVREGDRNFQLSRDAAKYAVEKQRHEEDLKNRLEAARIAARGKPTHMPDGQGGLYEVSGTSANQVKIAGTDEPFKGQKDLSQADKVLFESLTDRLKSLQSDRSRAFGQDAIVARIDSEIAELKQEQYNILSGYGPKSGKTAPVRQKPGILGRMMGPDKYSEWLGTFAPEEGQLGSGTGMTAGGGIEPTTDVGGSPASAAQNTNMPPIGALKEGQVTEFANGEEWMLKNGKPVRVK